MHVGIILDGNRRWAKKQGWKPWKGHDEGFKKLNQILDWVVELGISELSLYCFSIQNFNRADLEKRYLFDIFRREAKKLLEDKRVYDKKVKIRFAGRLEMFPEDMQELMKEVMSKTALHDQHIINFAIGYGGREEIVDTVKKIVAEGKEINEENLQAGLWIPKDVDLVIRASGEFRISNFLLWQANYAEWFFLDKFWPDFKKDDLVKAIKEFKEKRERRFGG